jgi:hypothetical protein
VQYSVSGVHVHDARLAAAMYVYRVGHVLTYIGKGLDDLFERWRQRVLEDKDVMRRAGAFSRIVWGYFARRCAGLRSR